MHFAIGIISIGISLPIIWGFGGKWLPIYDLLQKQTYAECTTGLYAHLTDT